TTFYVNTHLNSTSSCEIGEWFFDYTAYSCKAAMVKLWINLRVVLGWADIDRGSVSNTILTGVVLAIQYVSEASSAFESVVVIWIDDE
ncbi:unnamed protein product, partial [Cyprideis torosa]